MRSAVVFALLTALAGCASPGERSPFDPSAASVRRSHASSSSQYLYVASLDCSPYKNGCVTEYAPGSTTPLRTIVAKVDKPARLAIDHAGNLYVSNTAANTVTVYAPGATQPKLTITEGIHGPVSLGISRSGNVFVANIAIRNSGAESGDVTVYAPGGTKPVRTIKRGVNGPRAFAFDRQDNAYVANLGAAGSSIDDSKGAIAEYAQGGTTPIRTITRGINSPWGLAFDSTENLYVANWGAIYAIYYPESSGNVGVYAPGGTKPKLKIRQGMGNPYAVAIDSQDVLYAAAGYNKRWVTEYAKGTTTVLRTIPTDSFTMILDRGDNLYVGRYASVDVYAPGTTAPAYTIPIQGMAFALGDQ